MGFGFGFGSGFVSPNQPTKKKPKTKKPLVSDRVALRRVRATGRASVRLRFRAGVTTLASDRVALGRVRVSVRVSVRVGVTTLASDRVTLG